MILIEMSMSIEQAKKIFGITNIPSESELKVLYRRLALAHHSDRHGGSDEEMININFAYDILQKVSTKGVGGENSWEYHQRTPEERAAEEKRDYERDKKVFGILKDYFNRTFDEEALKEYIQSFVDEPLIYEYSDNEKNEERQKYRYVWSGSTPYRKVYTLRNEDNTIYFAIEYSIYNRVTHSTGLGYDGLNEDDILFSVSANTSIYYNKRKVKIAQRDWQGNLKTKILDTPEELFPKTKLKKALSTSSSKLFRKKDMLLGLQRELNATFNKNWIYLYIFGPTTRFYVIMNRFAFSNYGNSSLSDRLIEYSFFGIRGISPETHKEETYEFFSKARHIRLSETPEELEKLVKALKMVVKDVDTHRMDIVENYKIICKAIEDSLLSAFPLKNKTEGRNPMKYLNDDVDKDIEDLKNRNDNLSRDSKRTDDSEKKDDIRKEQNKNKARIAQLQVEKDDEDSKKDSSEKKEDAHIVRRRKPRVPLNEFSFSSARVYKKWFDMALNSLFNTNYPAKAKVIDLINKIDNELKSVYDEASVVRFEMLLIKYLKSKIKENSDFEEDE